MQLGKLWVFHLQVGGLAASRAAGVEGGQLDITDEIRSIFEPAFLGKERRSPARQPFHFNLGGKIRSNSTREHVLSILEEGNPEAEKYCEALAVELNSHKHTDCGLRCSLPAIAAFDSPSAAMSTN
jgi:hypothetical protein